ncbi:MAG TPA: hypothetical protein VM055_09045 [Novosphingobium sp.]|nr:hypothetical protein [Novosphingobium sp.]
MDRQRAARRLLTAAALASTAAWSAATDTPLAALRWTEPTLALDALTRAPPECLSAVAVKAERARVEVGRAAFRAPALLGGQAARLGLSCESCHVNGRGNRAFRFPGLSGAPGTADVTAPLMSAHRGDEVFDPKPIPDLARPAKVSRATGDPALAKFIRGLIVEEFDGREPPPAVLDGLVAYVRAIDARVCPTSGDAPLGSEFAIDAAIRGVAAARERQASGDRESARLMLASARSALGRLGERYPALPASRSRLLAADDELLSLQRAIGSGGPKLDEHFRRWLARADRWRVPLLRDASRSLYDPKRLAAALGECGATCATASRSTR